MAIRMIRKGNEEILKEKASLVKEITPNIIGILEDMAETMYCEEGIGLAANQIGIPKRLVVIDIQDGNLLELINPEIMEQEGKEVGIEGCLSFPGILGEVPRATRVVVEALNREGKKIKLEANGLLARVLQHEIDHLEGKLLVDRAVRFLEEEEN
ncbi:MAG: peptide deformylase [Candidatus Syntrophonatronum acetioxidans]|uniref:Peptide deformylase n=1 Tax=Candidatus Syntrophonatronum acetioxidans TaxID=1795816 RepID=A0A424YHV0_9FIRM|nr:MAG: peptide deformylase [Candidatus Syntrophonatronum acetioxidans]